MLPPARQHRGVSPLHVRADAARGPEPQRGDAGDRSGGGRVGQLVAAAAPLERPSRAVVFVDQGYALLAVANSASLGSGNPAMEAMNDTVDMLEKYHSGCPDSSTRRSSPARR
jgi:hypothetical protein